MARPRTKGETIGVQLPLPLDTEIRAAAAALGVSPGVYIANQISHHPPATRTDNNCDHPRIVTVARGRHVCLLCRQTVKDT